jgi:hypothetical protein
MSERTTTTGRVWALALLVLVTASGGSWLVVDRLSSSREPSRERVERTPSRATAPQAAEPEADPDHVSVEVRGFIIAHRTGDPIPGARVSVEIGEEVRETRTDATGNWGIAVPVTVANWHAWGFFFTVEADGWISDHWWRRVRRDRPVCPVRTIVLKPVAAWVSGRVVDPDGAPISGAHGLLESTSLEPGEDGRFPPVPVGAGVVQIRMRAFGWISTQKDVTVLPEPNPIRRTVEVVLHPAEWVEGMVVDETGRPIQGARVRHHDEGPVLASTDEKGRFRWPISESNWGRLNVTADGHVHAIEANQLVRRLGDNLIVLHRAAPLVGRLLLADGKPLTDAVIGCGGYSWGKTGADGAFRIDAVRLGRVELGVRRYGFRLGSLAVDIPPPAEGLTLRMPPLRKILIIATDEETGEPVPGTRIERAGIEVSILTDDQGRAEILLSEELEPGPLIWLTYPGFLGERLPLVIPPPGQPVRFVRPPLLPSRARVVTQGGLPVPGASVTVLTGPEEIARAVTSADGVARFGVPAGLRPYMVKAEHPTLGFGSAPVPEGDGSVDVEVVLDEPPGIVAVRVIGEDDEPLSGAYTLLDDDIHRANDEGIIRLPIWRKKDPPQVFAPWCVTRSLGEPPMLGDPTRVVVLTRWAEIRGVVLDGRGRPVPGVRVFSDDTPQPTDVSDGRGRFSLSGIPVGQARYLFYGLPGVDPIPGTWAEAGGEEVRIVVPCMATVRFRASPEALSAADPEEENGHVVMTYPDRVDEWTGFVAQQWLFAPARLRHDWIARVPAGRAIVAFTFGDEGVLAEVTLEAGRETLLRLSPTPRLSLSGRVLDANGAPVPDAEVRSAYHLHGLGWTKKDGCLEFTDEDNLFPWPTRIVVEADGYAPFVTGRIDLRSAPDLTVRLTRGGTLRLRALDARGPVSGCTVVPFGQLGGHLRWGKTDDDGASVLEHLPAGSRLVLVRRGKELPVRRTVVIEEGKTAELTVTLPDR